MSASESSIVMVPVPVDRLSEVYHLLGTSLDGDTTARALPTSTWSHSDIARLHQELGPTKAARAILDLGSAQPGQAVWFHDVCLHVDRSHPSVASELGGFTKLLKSRFGRADWPFRVDWVGGRALYTVDEEIARAWLGHNNQGKAPSA